MVTFFFFFVLKVLHHSVVRAFECHAQNPTVSWYDLRFLMNEDGELFSLLL